MKFRRQYDAVRTPTRGSVCIIRLWSESGIITVPAVIVSVATSTVVIKRCCKDDVRGSRHLIKDVAPTGLEYAAFIDTATQKVNLSCILRVIGRLSKRDLSYI